MPAEAAQIETIGLMAAHESALADLYRAYADKFVDQRDFWRQLADDEVRHARWIAGFADDVKAGTTAVNPGRFSSKSILASLDEVRGHVHEIEDDDLSFVDALLVAKKFEDGLIESRYFEIVEDDGPELRDLLTKLEGETNVHRGQVAGALEAAGGKAHS